MERPARPALKLGVYMSRELNRDLFMEKLKENLEASVPSPPTFAKAEDARLLSLHIETLQKRMKEFESRLEQSNTRMEELIVGNKQRFERVQGHFHRQTEMLQAGFQDCNEKIAHMASRVNERRIAENAVKELVERHGQVVQAFEVRIQQMQKLISEQEMQLMAARAEIREAVKEIARIKKL